jgi:hypothetical protein
MASLSFLLTLHVCNRADHDMINTLCKLPMNEALKTKSHPSRIEWTT